MLDLFAQSEGGIVFSPGALAVAGSLLATVAGTVAFVFKLLQVSYDKRIEDLIKQRDAGAAAIVQQIQKLETQLVGALTDLSLSLDRETKEMLNEFRQVLQAINSHSSEERVKLIEALRIEVLKLAGKNG